MLILRYTIIIHSPTVLLVYWNNPQTVLLLHSDTLSSHRRSSQYFHLLDPPGYKTHDFPHSRPSVLLVWQLRYPDLTSDILHVIKKCYQFVSYALCHCRTCISRSVISCPVVTDILFLYGMFLEFCYIVWARGDNS